MALDYLPPLSHVTGSRSEQPRLSQMRSDVLFADGYADTQSLDAPEWIPVGATVGYAGRHVAFGESHTLRINVFDNLS